MCTQLKAEHKWLGLGPMNHQLLVEASIVVLTSIKFRLRNFHLGYSNDKSKKKSSKTPQINPNKLLLNLTTKSTFLNNHIWFKFAIYRPWLEKVQFWSLLLLKKSIRSNNVLISKYGIHLLNNIFTTRIQQADTIMYVQWLPNYTQLTPGIVCESHSFSQQDVCGNQEVQCRWG